jgi:hypothetical protein
MEDDMESINDISKDLAFIAKTVEGSKRVRVPSVYLLWAIIIPIGFAMVDFRPQFVGTYWSFLGPIGGVLSGYLGWKSSRHLGQLNRSEAFQTATHWFSMMIAIVMTSTLIDFGYITPKGLGLVILILVSLSYFMAGNYLDKNMRKIGIVMALGFFPIAFLGQYVWTALGIIVSAGLVLTAIIERKNVAKI